MRKKLLSLQGFALLAFSLLSVEPAAAQSRSFTANLTEAGTLADVIPAETLPNIDSLTVTGPINAKDIELLRNMIWIYGTAGSFTSYMDLSGARVVEGGTFNYRTFAGDTIQIATKNDVFPPCVFASCSGLNTIKLPSTIKEIGDSAFFNAGIGSIDIPATVERIDSKAFYGNYNLNEVNGGSNVKFIGDYAFNGATNVSSFSFSDELDSIGKNAFYSTALTSVSIPASVKYIGEAAFGATSNLTEFKLNGNGNYIVEEGGALLNKEKTLLLGYPCNHDGDSYDIPSTVTRVGESAFEGNSRLTSIYIPASVEELGDKAFSICSNLNKLDVDENNTHYAVRNGILCDYSGENALVCPALTAGNVIVPDGVKNIGSYCFYNATGITGVTLPASLETIGSAAFQADYMISDIHCKGLNPATFADESTFFFVGAYFPVTLHVPSGAAEAYTNEWVNGGAFVVPANVTVTEDEPVTDGISKTAAISGAEEVARYSINGTRISSPVRGINIIKMSDGSVRKVNVK